MPPQPHAPPKYPGSAYERVPTAEELEATGEERSLEKKDTRTAGVAAAADNNDDDDEPEHTRREAKRRTRLRWLFGCFAAVLLVGAFCRSAKNPVARYRGEFIPLFKPHPSDFNELFSGPSVMLDNFRFGLNVDNLELALEIPSALETLRLSLDELGFDILNEIGRSVAVDPPKLIDEEGNVHDPPPVHGDRPPTNLLLRPEPARIPHHHDTVNPPPVCFGPLKYAWQGPESFTVDVEEFEKFFVLVKSSYVGARIKVVDDPQSAQEGKVVVKPKIFMAERELNQVLEVSMLTNTTRKAKALRIGTPAWDASGNGRFNCIRAYLEVVFPLSAKEKLNDSPILKLFGVGTVCGEVDHASLPPLGSLVGWAVFGHVLVQSAKVSRCAALVTRDGIVKARRIGGDGDMLVSSINGPVEAGVNPTGQSSRITLKGINSVVRAHVSDEFSGKFHATTVNGFVKVSGERVEFDQKGPHFANGTYGSGNQTVDVSAINGPVHLYFGPMHHDHDGQHENVE